MPLSCLKFRMSSVMAVPLCKDQHFLLETPLNWSDMSVTKIISCLGVLFTCVHRCLVRFNFWNLWKVQEFARIFYLRGKQRQNVPTLQGFLWMSLGLNLVHVKMFHTSYSLKVSPLNWAVEILTVTCSHEGFSKVILQRCLVKDECFRA